jgi:hypothetical protein
MVLELHILEFKSLEDALVAAAAEEQKQAELCAGHGDTSQSALHQKLAGQVRTCAKESRPV